jgi:hypothetical protein
MAGQTPALQAAFHADQRVVAEPRRMVLRRDHVKAHPQGQLHQRRRPGDRHLGLPWASQHKAKALHLDQNGRQHPRPGTTRAGQARCNQGEQVTSVRLGTLGELPILECAERDKFDPDGNGYGLASFLRSPSETCQSATAPDWVFGPRRRGKTTFHPNRRPYCRCEKTLRSQQTSTSSAQRHWPDFSAAVSTKDRFGEAELRYPTEVSDRFGPFTDVRSHSGNQANYGGCAPPQPNYTQDQILRAIPKQSGFGLPVLPQRHLNV